MNLDTLLDETAPTYRPPSDAVLGRARAALDAQIRVSEQHVAAVARRSRRRRRTVVAIASVAAAAALVVAPVVGLGGSRPDSAQAAAVLTAAGAAAAEQPGGWSDAAYWHVVSEQQDGDGPAYHREIWLGRLVPGVLEDARLEDHRAGGPVRTIPLDATVFDAGAAVDWAGLYALPTDPDALERVLRAGSAGAGPDPDTELWVVVGDLLRETPASPQLRAALWDVAARVPGVTVVGTVQDHAGRTGKAVERTMPGSGRERLILDTSDGRLLEQVDYGPSGGARYRQTILSQGPAATAPAADPQQPKSAQPSVSPDGDTAPACGGTPKAC
ncbi:CU044_5270 family protein [Cellulomonas alba]|uniref:CU044_5270 family protein n=1 Tax=Cellulomonas alba TaxID=3053467 RepID=A0ABT7SGP5_9CELL|nr:CU044_5270 family protein [Cellulomonas alba]MDM7855316.1 CU044_5270 family protein [Cellulomonas alba]